MFINLNESVIKFSKDFVE